MPRNKNSSDSRSRSRSPKNKRYRKSSSDSESSRKKHKYDKKEKDYYSKPIYTLKSRSDIKNHIIYENVRIRHKSDESEIMDGVKKIIKEQFGPVDHITPVKSDDDNLTFNVGFKYDKDAFKFVNEGTAITNTLDKTKMIGKATLVFENCFPMIKELIKESKRTEKRLKSPENRKTYKRSTSSERDHKKKRYSPRPKSYEKKQSKKDYKSEEKSIWMFGLPWSIKGKEVQTYLADHTSGPFPVLRWRWVRVKGSNCEFMELTLDQKKANKLLALRQQQQIEGCPCIIASASSEGETQETIKEIMRDYQLRVNFPERINPSALYKALNDLARVVQIVSCQKMVDGRSDSFIVTLGSSSKARDIKRLGLLSSSGIRIEDTKGQLVFRPTKHSKLTEH